MFQIKKASRKVSKMKIGLFGPSGSGKTYSAIRLAMGMIDDHTKIVVIDTENGSADLYSDLCDYHTLTLEPPYSPDRYIKAIELCEREGFQIIVIDSISHEWEGIGGCLDIHTSVGGKFQDWSKVTPLHNKFIQKIVQSSAHVIVTGRSKVDYAMVHDGGKKTKVEKVGLKTVTREGFDYEMTVSFMINQSHLASTDKDRTNMFNSGIPFLITEEIGKKIRDWNNSGLIDYEKKIIDKIMQLTWNGADPRAMEILKADFQFQSSAEIKSWDLAQQQAVWERLKDVTAEMIIKKMTGNL